MNIKSKFYLGIASVASMSLLPMTAYARGMYEDGGAASAGGALAGFAIFLFLLMLVFWLAIFALWVFWLVMVIDIAKREWKNDGDRAAYLVLVIFLNIIGALIYYFVVKRQLDIKSAKQIKK